MNIIKNICPGLLLAFGGMLVTSCDDVFEPAQENFKNIEQMYTDGTYAQGFLINAYRDIPGYYDDSEYATDNAVTNQKNNSWLNMTQGTWTSSSNPTDQWSRCLGTIQNLNLFLANCDKVKWADDEEPNALFCVRMKGEAYGLRALYMYYLLRAHAGYSADGTLLGVPVLTEFQDANANFNVGRATFKECIDQIYADLDNADKLLPMEYEDVASDEDVPERYRNITKRAVVYNRVMGQYARQLFNGLIGKAFRTRTALLAASPAFLNGSSDATWAYAADAAATVLDYVGGPSGLVANGLTYYCNTAEIDGLKEGINPPEIIWRENLATNNMSQEQNNFPPSLFGKGYMNPTQNLVDAFPMANGYPITDERSGYDATRPYAGRDPRLALYIIYDGAKEGVSNSVIRTGSKIGTDDGVNVKETSTRTGYYMKKRLRMDVNCKPSSKTGKNHYTPRIRYTEMFLDYAEAANEAWGPKEANGHTYSAYDVIKAIRTRAGVGGSDDAYLEECSQNKEKMRELIRNERRLELCFESFRFWDLRRWKANLNETAMGVNPGEDGFTSLTVETRSFKDYMYYGPIPYSETLKYSNLIQNNGW